MPMADETPSVSVRWYLAGVATTIAGSTVRWALVLAPLVFGDPAWVGDGSAPDARMQLLGPGWTLPTILGLAFVAGRAVGHSWLYVHYPRFLDR